MELTEKYNILSIRNVSRISQLLNKHGLLLIDELVL